MTDYGAMFARLGGEFRIPFSELSARLAGARALLFDWDGIFNSGEKGVIPSTFSEIDSMGVNMLRFGYYLLRNEIPFTAIVTGETNPTAFNWARREHLDHVFFQVKHKADLVDYLKKQQGLEAGQILFVYDDIPDLSLAELAGARFLVPNEGSQLFIEYCRQKGLCDYICSRPGRAHAVREISELVLAAIGKFEETIEKRTRFHPIYRTYYQLRNQKETSLMQASEHSFVVRPFPDV
jgi:3-deoxy-D-manno-octulosonate 8-phosphate phosphatase (KDO 8-P phosphatase)